MNPYVTSGTIRRLREGKRLTQQQLADRIGVGCKAVYQWEAGRGLPDIALLGRLAAARGVSVPELMSGEPIVNRNVSCNMLKTKLYVCPVCGNVIHCAGEALVSCCGITLPPLEAEEPDEAHGIIMEESEDERFITIDHPMTKEHYISFLAYVTADRFQLVKLYPEGEAQTRLRLRGRGKLYFFCNRHGLYQRKFP